MSKTPWADGLSQCNPEMSGEELDEIRAMELRLTKLEADRAELVEALRNLTTQPPRTINFNAARALLARLEDKHGYA